MQVFIRTLLLVFFVFFGQVWGATIYISPNGVDTQNGQTKKTAFKTIGRAIKFAYSGKAQSNNVEIVVLHGNYSGQYTSVQVPKDPPQIKITGEVVNGEKPVFSDGPRNRTWLIVKANERQDLGLVIENLEIRNYFAVLSIVGNRDDEAGGNRGVTIRNNVFSNIGSTKNNSHKKISTAALSFVSSQGNVIENNSFINIKNDEGCSAIHGIYLAHFSSNNVIRNNIFDSTCGAPIKLRDRANNNQITGNKFSKLSDGVSPIQEWFCDKGDRRGCTKKRGECPSINNIITDNQLDSRVLKNEDVEIVGNRIQRSWCSSEAFSSKRISN